MCHHTKTKLADQTVSVSDSILTPGQPVLAVARSSQTSFVVSTKSQVPHGVRQTDREGEREIACACVLPRARVCVFCMHTCVCACVCVRACICKDLSAVQQNIGAGVWTRSRLDPPRVWSDVVHDNRSLGIASCQTTEAEGEKRTGDDDNGEKKCAEGADQSRCGADKAAVCGRRSCSKGGNSLGGLSIELAVCQGFHCEIPAVQQTGDASRCLAELVLC